MIMFTSTHKRILKDTRKEVSDKLIEKYEKIIDEFAKDAKLKLEAEVFKREEKSIKEIKKLNESRYQSELKLSYECDNFKQTIKEMESDHNNIKDKYKKKIKILEERLKELEEKEQEIKKRSHSVKSNIEIAKDKSELLAINKGKTNSYIAEQEEYSLCLGCKLKKTKF